MSLFHAELSSIRSFFGFHIERVPSFGQLLGIEHDASALVHACSFVDNGTCFVDYRCRRDGYIYIYK